MKKIWKNLLVVLLLCAFGLSQPEQAPAAEKLSGAQVITMMRERPDGDDRRSELTMTLVNRRGSKRVRVLELVAKDYGKDSKSLITFRSPADVNGTKFLSWTYEDPDREDDKWLYVPAMKKVRRISGAANNDFFMGSDFTYDDIDMGKRQVNKDTHTLLAEEKFGPYDCWKVESIPVDKDEPTVRRLLWIDKKTLIVVHLEYYEKKGLTRVYDVLKLQQQDGIWSVQSAKMDNKADEHQTLIAFGPVTYNKGADDALFQVAVLQRSMR